MYDHQLQFLLNGATNTASWAVATSEWQEVTRFYRESLKQIELGVFWGMTSHLMPGSAHNRGKHRPRCVVAGEAGLAHPGAIVDD